MNVSVFGLGYVGSVSAGCLAEQGHSVIGVDVNAAKVDALNAGQSPVREPGLEQLIGPAVAAGRLRATMDANLAVRESEISLICVGTPSARNGRPNSDHLDSVCTQLGDALASGTEYHVVAVRSTVFPGTVDTHVIPLLEARSGRQRGAELGACMIPEFLREGSGVRDYNHPPYVVIGALDERSASLAAELFAGVDAPVIPTALRVAEMLKYASNAFHAVKIAFANEIGVVAKEYGVDGRAVMELVAKDTTLNASAAYLSPGFAFGGSCLPKDLRALVHRTRGAGLECPVVEAALVSNARHLERCIEAVEADGSRRAAVLGLSFKAGTDDVRESPGLALAETLIGRGYEVVVYDEHVDPARLVGANRAFLERELPHIATLMRPSLEEVAAEADVFVIANLNPHYRRILELARPDQRIVDLAGLFDATEIPLANRYESVCW